MEKKHAYSSEELQALLTGFADKIGFSIGNKLGGLIGRELAKIEVTKILNELVGKNDYPTTNDEIGSDVGSGRCPGGKGGGGIIDPEAGSGRCPGGKGGGGIIADPKTSLDNIADDDSSKENSSLSSSPPQILSVKKVGKNQSKKM